MSKLKTTLAAAAIVGAGATSAIAGVCKPSHGDFQIGISSNTSIISEANRFVGNGYNGSKNPSARKDWACCYVRLNGQGRPKAAGFIRGKEYTGQRYTSQQCKRVLGY